MNADKGVAYVVELLVRVVFHATGVIVVRVGTDVATFRNYQEAKISPITLFTVILQQMLSALIATNYII